MKRCCCWLKVTFFTKSPSAVSGLLSVFKYVLDWSHWWSTPSKWSEEQMELNEKRVSLNAVNNILAKNSQEKTQDYLFQQLTSWFIMDIILFEIPCHIFAPQPLWFVNWIFSWSRRTGIFEQRIKVNQKGEKNKSTGDSRTCLLGM